MRDLSCTKATFCRGYKVARMGSVSTIRWSAYLPTQDHQVISELRGYSQTLVLNTEEPRWNIIKATGRNSATVYARSIDLIPSRQFFCTKCRIRNLPQPVPRYTLSYQTFPLYQLLYQKSTPTGAQVPYQKSIPTGAQVYTSLPDLSSVSGAVSEIYPYRCPGAVSEIYPYRCPGIHLATRPFLCFRSRIRNLPLPVPRYTLSYQTFPVSGAVPEIYPYRCPGIHLATRPFLCSRSRNRNLSLAVPRYTLRYQTFPLFQVPYQKSIPTGAQVYTSLPDLSSVPGAVPEIYPYRCPGIHRYLFQVPCPTGAHIHLATRPFLCFRSRIRNLLLPVPRYTLSYQTFPLFQEPYQKSTPTGAQEPYQKYVFTGAQVYFSLPDLSSVPGAAPEMYSLPVPS
ncbi:hypothetical protein RRG08_064652 [Elysia crispata]|uniref:Uncharacterized protein n=1 Tax=Elysia crispata TaxID=231223 RepID=A0AAE1B928_9GAST|nr:hypothetical protein RRG08_064652 [Elysia crispata]